MGSPTSFPVLCLVNAAMLWTSVNIYEKDLVSWNYVKKHYRPLINGDDISFLSNPDHYEVWKKVCSASGLSLSPGKNYCSENFLNINSTTYWVTDTIDSDENKITVNFEQVFVVNSGLIKGQSKVLTKQEKATDTSESLMPICDQLDECLESANPVERERVYKIFFQYNKEKLRSSHRPWTLPRQFGGLGIPREVVPNSTIQQKELDIAISQLSKYRDLSDIPLKYQFSKLSNELLNSYVEKMEPIAQSFRMTPLLTESTRMAIDGEIEVASVPSLADYVLKRGLVEEEMYFKRRKGDKRTGLRGLKRKPAEYNYMRLKRKKFPSPLPVNCLTPEIADAIFNCPLQKPGCVNYRVQIEVAEPSPKSSSIGVPDSGPDSFDYNPFV
jgi:hypothetical protein